jgi:hypothetical protein
MTSHRTKCMLIPALLVIVVFPGCGPKKADARKSALSDISSQSASPKELDLNTYLIHFDVDTNEVLGVDSTCIMEFPPTEEEHAQAIRDSTEAAFKTGSEEYSYFVSFVNQRADSLNVRIRKATRRYLRFAVNDTLSLLLDTKSEGSRHWDPFLFKKGKAPVVFGLEDNPDTKKIDTYFRSNP